MRASLTATARRPTRVSRRRCEAVALLTICLMLACALGATPARAISGQDMTDIQYLRSIFSIGSERATDAELAQVLDSPDLGPSIRGDIACAFHGEHALDATAADQAEMEGLLAGLDATIGAETFANPLIELLLADNTAALFLFQLHENLSAFQAEVPAFVSALATLYSDHDYRELLAEYHGFETDGMSADEARAEMVDEFGSLLDSVAHARSLSKTELLDQFEYSSGCMTLVEDSGARTAYANYVSGVVADLRDYGGAGSKLVLVPVQTDSIVAVNGGGGLVDKTRILDAGHHAIGATGSLEPHESAIIGLDGSASEADSVELSVDHIEGLNRSYADLERDLYVGSPTTEPVAGQPMALRFSFDAGPFLASGTSATYQWNFGDTTTSSQAEVTHTYACPGDFVARFTATQGATTQTRTTTVSVPPGYAVDWTTDGTAYSVAPGVPLGFHADQSIPADATVSWSFGDGGTAIGRDVTHTFSSPAVQNVTMSVTAAHSSCSALTALHKVTIGRSDQWVPLSGTIGSYTMSSSVAGYVLAGTVNLARNATLTVEPGTNVKFVPAAGNPGQLVVNGRLNVVGAAGAPAVFTSQYDDSAGGHCSCAPSGHVPAAGDWYGLTIAQGGTATFDHADLRYANHDIDLQDRGATIDVSNSTLSDASVGLYSQLDNAITVDASMMTRDGTGMRFDCFGCAYSPQITDTTFSHDGTGVSVSGLAAPRLEGSDFVDVTTEAALEATATRTVLAHTTVDDGPGFIDVFGSSFPAGAVRLGSDLQYVIFGQPTVPATGQLTVAAGTVVKLASAGGSRGQLLVNGSLILSGTSASPAVVTSQYDDSAGGHCSCAPSGHTPASGDWYGLTIQSGGRAILDHAVVRYASHDLDLQLSGAAVDVANSSLTDAGVGVFSGNANSVAVASSTLARDDAGMQFDCFGCAYSPQITDAEFVDDSTGVSASGLAAPQLDRSRFRAVTTEASLEATATRTVLSHTTVDDGPGLIRVFGSSFPAGVVSLASDLPYLLSGQQTVPATGQLTLPPGAIVKFAPAAQLVVRGGLNIAGSSAAPAVVTSQYDDSAGGHCPCAAAGRAPAPGDWFGMTIQSGGTAALNWADVRYAGRDIDVPSSGASVNVTNSRLTDAGNGLYSAAANAIAVDSSAFVRDGTGMQLDCNGCAPYAPLVTNTRFVEDATGVSASGLAAPEIHGSEFDPAHDGVVTGLGSTVDATGNWWGDPTGPRPSGRGARISGNVLFQPFCTTSACATVDLALDPRMVIANGRAQTTATVTATADGRAASGADITLTSSDPDEAIGPLVDHSDGTYTATITVSHAVGSATITATDGSTSPPVSATTSLEQVAPTVTVSLGADTIPADGAAQTTAVATITGPGGAAVIGESVSFASSDAGQAIGPVVDHGDGTYTATITASHAPGDVTITATDASTTPSPSATATLTQRQVVPTVELDITPSTVTANGRAQAIARATIAIDGAPLSGESVSFASDDAGQVVGPVVDHGDGTYTATITASHVPGTETITATDISTSTSPSATATLTQTSPTVDIAASPSRIVANGRAQATVTATVTGPGGAGLAEEHLSFASSDATERVGLVTDHGDGTYTAVVTASTKVGVATLTATDASVSPAATDTTTLEQATAPRIALSLTPTSIVADDRSQTIVTATVTTGGLQTAGERLTFASSDPGQSIGAVTDHGDGTYTATITSSRRIGSTTITATDESIGPPVTKTINLKQVAPIVSATLAPATLAADGSSRTTATITVLGGSGLSLSGEHLALASSDADEAIGPVVDHGDGTYTASITASRAIATATITAMDASVTPAITKTAKLKQVAPAIVLSVVPTSIVADGVSTATVTATLTAGGLPVSANDMSFSSSDPEQAISPVIDHGDGTYTAVVTASRTIGTATITATDASIVPQTIKTVKLKQSAPSMTLAITPTAIRADGVSQATATVRVAADGIPLIGEALVFASSDSGQTIGSIIDHGDGSYTVLLTASRTTGTTTISATDMSARPGITKTASLRQR